MQATTALNDPRARPRLRMIIWRMPGTTQADQPSRQLARAAAHRFTDLDCVSWAGRDGTSRKGEKCGKRRAVGENFFENHAQAKRAMKDNLFTEVYVSTAVTTPIQVKGWVTQANPYQRHGQRWHLYLSRVEVLRRLAARHRKNLLAQGRPSS
jgi:hypothetical protein